jgi:hypothetical protein
MSIWTTEEIANLKKYRISLFKESCSIEDSLNPDMPYDVYLVVYHFNDSECMDLVRCAKTVDIFDAYYDKFGKESIKKIKQSAGKINPKLFSTKQESKSKSRS